MQKRIYANYDENTVTVYQAYNSTIADEAVQLGTLGPSFGMNRMTWIKPSFLWMMERAGWSSKENQERILSIHITHDAFKTILSNAVLSSFDQGVYKDYDTWKEKLKSTDVRCQWDPDRDIFGGKTDRHAIQLGIKGSILYQYVHGWIQKIEDITPYVQKTHEMIKLNDYLNIQLPLETEYPVDIKIAQSLGMDV